MVGELEDAFCQFKDITRDALIEELKNEKTNVSMKLCVSRVNMEDSEHQAMLIKQPSHSEIIEYFDTRIKLKSEESAYFKFFAESSMRNAESHMSLPKDDVKKINMLNSIRSEYDDELYVNLVDALIAQLKEKMKK